MSRHWLTRRTEIGRNLGGNLGLDAAPVVIWSKPASSLFAGDALATTQLEPTALKAAMRPQMSSVLMRRAPTLVRSQLKPPGTADGGPRCRHIEGS